MQAKQMDAELLHQMIFGHLNSSFFVRIIKLCLDLRLLFWNFFFLENVFFPCNVLSYLNVIEDHNLIGTLSEIEKHSEASPGIVSEASIHVTNASKAV